MRPPRPFVRIRDSTVGIPSSVKGFRKRLWIVAVPLARCAGTVAHALPPPAIGSTAAPVAGSPPRRAHAQSAAVAHRDRLRVEPFPVLGSEARHRGVAGAGLGVRQHAAVPRRPALALQVEVEERVRLRGHRGRHRRVVGAALMAEVAELEREPRSGGRPEGAVHPQRLRRREQVVGPAVLHDQGRARAREPHPAVEGRELLPTRSASCRSGSPRSESIFQVVMSALKGPPGGS